MSEGTGPTFNSVTVDSDTSTSDTLMLFATGAAGKDRRHTCASHAPDETSGRGHLEDDLGGAHRLMARQLVGRSPGDMEAILRSIWSEGRWKMWPHFTQTVFAGIEVACWDALGRALGVPTRTFFGGAVRDVLPSISREVLAAGPDARALADAAARAAEAFAALVPL